MSTPLANKTTFSSRMKMTATTTAPRSRGPGSTNQIGPAVNGFDTRVQPKTTMKPPLTSRPILEDKKHLSGTTSRIAQPIRSKLAPVNAQPTSSRLGSLMAPTAATIQRTINKPPISRSSSKLSSVSSAVDSRISNCNNISVISTNSKSNPNSRQNSLASANSLHAATVRKPPKLSNNVNNIPDTNSVRRGLAKFQNPIECQRQFQVLISEKRELSEIIVSKDTHISKLQDQLKQTIEQVVGYATVVQYFANKLKIHSDIDLETEYNQLKVQVKQLLENESQYEIRLEAAVEEHKNNFKLERNLKESIETELEQTKQRHCAELNDIHEKNTNQINDLIEKHNASQSELLDRIAYLETELAAKTKDLLELRKDHETLAERYDKLEESLTKDKDARVKYVQDKANQLQKEVDSLNSVLEMRTERMHVLEKDSILLSEAQQELTSVKDLNKALKQQMESLTAALENKREKYEILLADSEKLTQELKRERKERRRMTMRTEKLELALNESVSSDSNIILPEPVDNKDFMIKE